MLVYPVPVQGAGAPHEIAAMLELADRRRDVEVLLLVRGGGSLEDLFAFNDESLARTIAGIGLPLITGIGHEIDFTIADFVADLRAPTPSAAAELAVPDAAAWLQALDVLTVRLRTAAMRAHRRKTEGLAEAGRRLSRLHPAQAVAQRMQRLDELQSRSLAATIRVNRTRRERLLRLVAELAGRSPATRLAALSQRIQHLESRLGSSAGHRIAIAKGQVQVVVRGLEATSPLATLGRGYAIVTLASNGKVVRDPSEAPPGSEVEARVARGQLRARVLGPKSLNQRGPRPLRRSRVRRWRGVRLSRRPSNGFSSLLKSTRTGVPFSLKASRKQLTRKRR